MTLEKARQLRKVQADFGGFYNRNAARLILAEVWREHAQGAVDALIRELSLGDSFGSTLRGVLRRRRLAPAPLTSCIPSTTS